MALLDNGCQVNTVTPEFVEAHTLHKGPMSDLVKGRVSMVGLDGMLSHPLGYIIIRDQIDGVGGYNEDQTALVIPDLPKFTSRVPATLGTPMIGRVINAMKESKPNSLVTPWVNA